MASNARESLTPPRELLSKWLGRLYRHHLTTTTGGNLSLIDDDGVMYITPSGGDKALVHPDNIAYRYPGTEIFEGPRKPSIEWPLHTAAYHVRPDCRAVLHAHSNNLVAFSLFGGPSEGDCGDGDGDGDGNTRSPLARIRRPASPSSPKFFFSHDSTFPGDGVPDTRCLLGTWNACGRVALSPYCLPGSKELADGVTKALRTGADCVILQNHGVVTVGSTLAQAYDRFVSLEYLARSIVHALPLGRPRPLPDRVLAAGRPLPPDFPKVAAASPGNFPVELPAALPSCAAARCGCCSSRRRTTGAEKAARSELCRYVKRAYEQNLVTSSSGSFSIRTVGGGGGGDDHHDGKSRTSLPHGALTSGNDEHRGRALSMLVTPTNVDRATLEPSDLCFVSDTPSCDHMESCCDCPLDEDGSCGGEAAREAKRRRIFDIPNDGHSSRCRMPESKDCGEQALRFHPYHLPQSSESVMPSRAAAMHAAIYRAHPEVSCVMMVQPPYATAYCITGKRFNSSGLPESRVILQDVHTLSEDALEDGGTEVARALDPDRGRHTVLISGFGMVTVGKDLLKTFVQIEVCEAMCAVTLTAMRRGAVRTLTPEEVKEVDTAFSLGH